MNRFPIGFWNYTHIDQLDVSCVEDWDDCGMTLPIGPSYDSTPAQTAKMRDILDACAERDMKVILSHRDGYFRRLGENGEEAFRKNFTKAVDDLGDHPAAFGFHVGDEPQTAAFDDACKALAIHKEIAPHLTPFCNLLPWVWNNDTLTGWSDWKAYLDEYILRSGCDFTCYDCYMQMYPEPSLSNHGLEVYFRNLNYHREATAAHGIPFWTTLLSVGHFNYRCPREDDFRWQLNTALAHGAKGILYFFLYMRKPHQNYRIAPIDEHWERTETFEWLSRVNRTFLKWQSPVVDKLTLQSVYHTGQAWGLTPQLGDDDPVISGANATGGQPMIVSHFTHDETGADYVMLVNNSQAENVTGELRVRGRRPKLHRVDWGAAEQCVTPENPPRGAGKRSGEDYAYWSDYLAPGQMELFRVESESDG